MGESKLEGMLTGNTLEDKKQNAAEFVAPGGRGINDYSLEAPGLANNLRAAAAANERVIQSMPVYVTDIMTEHCAQVQEMLASSTQRMEMMQRKAANKQRIPMMRAICPASVGMGAMLGVLATLGIAWFWIIPAQVSQRVAQQRGADWAIGEYLATPAGTAVRNHFRGCKAKGGCKS
jgi:hypothetical protein